jgi:mono/diheme cytochrome c family protein
MLGRVGLALLLSVTLLPPALSQPTSDADALNEQQMAGRILVVQHCSLCHVRANINSNEMIGPALNKDSAGGRDEVLREVIANGTPRMPGFKYLFEPPQIDAVIAYLKTVPAGAPTR